MKRLSIKQELDILAQLKADDFLDNGSSRSVYSFGDNVVKIALDRKGQYQNHVEIKTFREEGDEYLAKIQSYGKYIVVMEKVLAYDRDFAEIMCNAPDEWEYQSERHEYEMTKELAYQFEDVKDHLDYVLGGSADNYQLGLTKDGRIVAYDYGYESESHEISVSSMYSYIDAIGYSELPILVSNFIKRKYKNLASVMSAYNLDYDY